MIEYVYCSMGATALSITTLPITTLPITTLSIIIKTKMIHATFSIMTLNME
jgi:hypothetical protein